MFGPEIRVQEGQELVVPHPDAVSGLEQVEPLHQAREDEMIPGNAVILPLRWVVVVHGYLREECVVDTTIDNVGPRVMVNSTAVLEWLELSDCNVTHWLMVLLGCVAAMSEGMGISKKTRHNGILHLCYNILTSKCCCPDPVPPASPTASRPVDVDGEDADDEEDVPTAEVELTPNSNAVATRVRTRRAVSLSPE